MLILHLTPNGVRTLHPRLDVIFESHLIERLTDRVSELLEQIITLSLRHRQLLLYGRIGIGMFNLKAEILKFSLYLVQSQAVGKWGVDIQRFASNLILFIGRLRCQCAHIVKAVTNLYQYDTNVITHRKQQLFEVLSLCRGLLTKDSTAYLRQSVNNLSYLMSEDIVDILHRVVGILDDIMQQCRADACRAQSHLLARYLCHGYRVHDIRFARQPAHTFMGLPCEIERLRNNVHFLPVP